MVATIEHLVKELETNFSPEDRINIGSKVYQHLKVKMSQSENGAYHFVTCEREDDEWCCLNLPYGASKVCEVLETLKSYLPQHKDKSVCVYYGGFNIVENKMTKTCTLNFSKTIDDLPEIGRLSLAKQFKKFEVELTKFKERVSSASEPSGNKTQEYCKPSLLQAAQLLLMQNSELGCVYCVSDSFYHTFSDVVTAYPELDDLDEKNLFSEQHGIKVCKISESELKNLCQDRKSPKYVIDAGFFTRDELLKQYSFPGTAIDKLFELDGNVMKCKSPEILSAFKIES